MGLISWFVRGDAIAAFEEGQRMARLGPAQAEAARQATATEARPNGPSPNSEQWLRDLMANRIIPAKHGLSGDERAARCIELLDACEMTQRQVSRAIDAFKDCPRKPTRGEPQLDPVAGAMDLVPSGHYAVKSDRDGQIKFYRLKQGRKSGVYWMHLQHGNEETQLSRPAANAVMRQIMRNPAEAMRMYGRHIGCCGKCHARLTNRISRILDIGPVCGGHFYEPEIWKGMQRAARHALLAAGLDPDTDVEDTDDLDRIRELARL